MWAGEVSLVSLRYSPSPIKPWSLVSSTQRSPLSIAIAAAVITIYVRSIFRVAELQGGFNSALANDQVTFMILEGAMVSIASLALTIMHPGPIFREFWKLAHARARLSGRASPDGVPLELKVEPKGVAV